MSPRSQLGERIRLPASGLEVEVEPEITVELLCISSSEALTASARSCSNVSTSSLLLRMSSKEALMASSSCAANVSESSIPPVSYTECDRSDGPATGTAEATEVTEVTR